MAAGTRDKMVRSAAGMLRTYGVRGTSFARVLTDSGAPRGSISHHFPGGKNEMILAAVTAAGSDISAQLGQLRDGGASAAQIVAAMCDYFSAGLTRTHYRAGCPVAAVANEAFDDDELRAAAQSAIAGWTRILSERLAAEGHPAREASELGQLCVAAVEGAITMARVQRTKAPITAVRAQLTVLLSRTDVQEDR